MNFGCGLKERKVFLLTMMANLSLAKFYLVVIDNTFSTFLISPTCLKV